MVISPEIGPSSTQIVSAPSRAVVDHRRPGKLVRSVSVPGAEAGWRDTVKTGEPRISTSPICVMDAEFVLIAVKLTL